MSTMNLGRAAALGAALLVSSMAASAATVSALRVMLHPYAAGWGELPAAQQARLESLVGTTLTNSQTSMEVFRGTRETEGCRNGKECEC